MKISWPAALTAVACLFVPGAAAAAAQCPPGFPAKPIQFVVGFGAGGGADVVARGVASAVEKTQNWVVVVENKPGSGGGVLASWLVSQPNDGYVIGVNGTDAVTINPVLNDVGYRWQDFDYLGSAMRYRIGLVAGADRPYADLAGLIAYAKEKGRATVAVSGIDHEVLINQIAEEYKVNLIAVPGMGGAEAMTSLLGGHVDAATQGVLHVAQIKAGKVRQLASLINQRVPYAPESRTLEEQGSKARPLDSYTIFMTPKGLNPAIKACLKQAIDEAVKSPDYAALMTKLENEPANLGEEGNIALIEKSAAFYRDALAKKKK